MSKFQTRENPLLVTGRLVVNLLKSIRGHMAFLSKMVQSLRRKGVSKNHSYDFSIHPYGGDFEPF